MCVRVCLKKIKDNPNSSNGDLSTPTKSLLSDTCRESNEIVMPTRRPEGKIHTHTMKKIIHPQIHDESSRRRRRTRINLNVCVCLRGCFR